MHAKKMMLIVFLFKIQRVSYVQQITSGPLSRKKFSLSVLIMV